MVDKLPIPNDVAERLLANPDIVSLGRGVDADGRTIVVVGVPSSAAQARVRRADAVPAAVEGVPMVVRVKGHARSLASLTRDVRRLSRLDRTRPVPPGVSAGHAAITAGTSSWLLTDGDRIYMASNRHIYAPLNLGVQRGDPIVQPGPIDSGADPDDTIARLSGFVSPHKDYKTDLAWAEPVADSVMTNRIVDAQAPDAPRLEPTPGAAVWKSGRTTGETSGVVEEVDVVIDDVDGHRMTEQFATTAMVLGGDSGSPVWGRFHDGEINPMGMVWGAFVDEFGEWTGTICQTIRNVEEESGLRLVLGPLDTGDGDGGGGDGGDGGDGDDGDDGGAGSRTKLALAGAAVLAFAATRDN